MFQYQRATVKENDYLDLKLNLKILFVLRRETNIFF